MTKEQLAAAIRVTDDAAFRLLDCLNHYRKEQIGREHERALLWQAIDVLLRESLDMTSHLDLLLREDR
jgi:hypothetical protein